MKHDTDTTIDPATIPADTEHELTICHDGRSHTMTATVVEHGADQLYIGTATTIVAVFPYSSITMVDGVPTAAMWRLADSGDTGAHEALEDFDRQQRTVDHDQCTVDPDTFFFVDTNGKKHGH